MVKHKRVHVELLKPAKHYWVLPQDNLNKCNSRYVIPPDKESSEYEDSGSPWEDNETAEECKLEIRDDTAILETGNESHSDSERESVAS
jgi:hypothetical protein